MTSCDGHYEALPLFIRENNLNLCKLECRLIVFVIFTGAFSPSHSAKSQHNGTIVLRPNKHKKKKNVIKNACRIL